MVTIHTFLESICAYPVTPLTRPAHNELRGVLDQHFPMSRSPWFNTGLDEWANACSGCDQSDNGEPVHVNECLVLRAHAVRFAGHPGFEEMWRLASNARTASASAPST